MSKKVEEVTKEMVKTAVAPLEKESATLIYCGPDITTIGLRQFSIFKNGIPENIKTLECKAIQALFSPVDELAKVRSQIGIKGSRENQLYNNVLKFVKEG